MSFISAPALDRLLESSQRGSTSQSMGMERESVLVSDAQLFYSPYTYSAMSNPPRPPSPSSFSPSPYVLNFKRRGPGGRDGKSAANSSGVHGTRESQHVQSQEELMRQKEDVSGSGQPPELGGRHEGASWQGQAFVNGQTIVHEDRMLPHRGLHHDPVRLLDFNKRVPQETSTEQSGRSGEGPRRNEWLEGEWGLQSSERPAASQFSSFSSHLPNEDEFFDAHEIPVDDYASDEETWRMRERIEGSGSRGDPDVDLIRQLDQEIKRRKAAEDVMAALQQQRNEMARQLEWTDGGGLGLIDNHRDESDTQTQAQKLVVARAVSGSIARAAIRAEVAQEVADKIREVARLRDKLQYYELVNHEMSQRNQEAIEIARRRRHRRQSRQRWLVGCMGATLCLGVSAAVVYKSIPWDAWRVHARAVLEQHLDVESQADSAHQSTLAA